MYPLIEILVDLSTRQIALISILVNTGTYAWTKQLKSWPSSETNNFIYIQSQSIHENKNHKITKILHKSTMHLTRWFVIFVNDYFVVACSHSWILKPKIFKAFVTCLQDNEIVPIFTSLKNIIFKFFHLNTVNLAFSM